MNVGPVCQVVVKVAGSHMANCMHGLSLRPGNLRHTTDACARMLQISKQGEKEKGLLGKGLLHDHLPRELLSHFLSLGSPYALWQFKGGKKIQLE